MLTVTSLVRLAQQIRFKVVLLAGRMHSDLALELANVILVSIWTPQVSANLVSMHARPVQVKE